uniref:ATP-dependent DNA helicase n=1 Tax=Tanacetum cinerariifolium TaxID=118510 RepID=A0A6L2KWQ9_TANCI|nr:DNA helicase [Tanacetum cinerariifolium]
MKTKRKLVPKDVVMGNVGEPKIVGVMGSCVSHVGEGSQPSVHAGSQLKCLVGRVVDGRHMENINDAGLCSAGNVIDDVGCSFHADEFIGTRGLQTLDASSSANQKRTKDVMSRTTTSNVGSSSSSTRRRLHSGRHSARTSVSNDDSVFLADTSNVHTNDFSLRGNRPPLEYKDVGKCDHSCEHCGAHFWLCCTAHIPNISRIYTAFATGLSLCGEHTGVQPDVQYDIFGARVDDSINVGRGPYVFKISCQLYHWLGSLCPAEGDPPRFLKLYVYDTENKVDNRMAHFGGDNSGLRRDIVEGWVFKRYENGTCTGVSSDEDRCLMMKAYYSYMIHDRVNSFNYLSKTGRLFQQYMVTAFCAVEQSRIDYIRDHQCDIRNDYLYGIYDAIRRGDSDGFDCGGRLIFPQSFTGGPRYIVVTEFMIHGPCGEICPTAACMKNSSRWTKHFLKEYCHNTYIDAAGFVHYRRRDTRITTTKDNIKLDNGQPQIVIDEIKNYLDSRYIGPHEACWRLFEFDIHPEPPVQSLQRKHAACSLRERDQLQKDDFVENNNICPAEGKIVLAVALSGIASLLLPSSRTTHSRFKLPLDLNDSSVCSITKNTQLTTLLKELYLIVCDESPMNDRRCFETLDRNLRDILDTPAKLFGGKPIMLGGDFRQTLPVKKKAFRTKIISSSIAESYLWPSFRLFVLTENMRLIQGTLSNTEKRNDENSATKLINFIYDAHILLHPTAKDLQYKAVVCMKNDTADVINAKIMNMIPGHNTTYISNDEAMPYEHDGGEVELIYPTEYMNTLIFAGIAPELNLKIGTPIILLRNINIIGGPRNGTHNVGDTSQQHRGKMILMEPEITYISELSTTDYDKTIKAIVYRKWTSKTTKTRTPTKFYCILIDKEGTPIQANMSLRDAEYFDQLLQL